MTPFLHIVLSHMILFFSLALIYAASVGLYGLHRSRQEKATGAMTEAQFAAWMRRSFRNRLCLLIFGTFIFVLEVAHLYAEAKRHWLP